MTAIRSSQEREVDRLSFETLRDAYCDLAAVIKLSRNYAQGAILQEIEKNVAIVLSQLLIDRAGNKDLERVIIAVAERMQTVLDQAHAPIALDVADLNELSRRGETASSPDRSGPTKAGDDRLLHSAYQDTRVLSAA
jgi:hypothetical protein